MTWTSSNQAHNPGTSPSSLKVIDASLLCPHTSIYLSSPVLTCPLLSSFSWSVIMVGFFSLFHLNPGLYALKKILRAAGLDNMEISVKIKGSTVNSLVRTHQNGYHWPLHLASVPLKCAPKPVCIFHMWINLRHYSKSWCEKGSECKWIEINELAEKMRTVISHTKHVHSRNKLAVAQ